MTVTVTYPPANGRCGPGFLVAASSNFVGPLGTNSFWNARLYDSTLVSNLATTTGADFSKSVSAVMGVIRPTPGNAFATQYYFSVNPVDARALDGATVKLVVDLIDGATLGIVDTVTQNVILDLQQGVPTLFTYLAVVLQQSTLGVDLAAVKAAVIRAYSNP